MPLKCLELYCGVGGFAAAIEGKAEITAAVDQNRKALAVYRHNFAHRALPRTVESLPGKFFAAANLWWLSPPCQPYTRRGRGRDLADPRAASLLVLLRRIQEHRPRYVALENVPPFRHSQARSALLEVLSGEGYTVRERSLCPTELSWPNRRKRYYLVAARGELIDWPSSPSDADGPGRLVLSDFVHSSCGDDLFVSPELVADYAGALDIVDADDPAAVTSCFTAAYGRSPVRSGSYLKTAGGVRRFSPREILGLLGFPPSFRLPSGLTTREAWRLVGNSLSVPAVRHVLACIPELAEKFELSRIGH